MGHEGVDDRVHATEDLTCCHDNKGVPVPKGFMKGSYAK